MKARAGLLQRALIVGVPIIAFLVAVGATVARTSDNPETVAAPATTLAVEFQPMVFPSPAPANTEPPAPTATPVVRADCAAIRGTEYQSPEERAWFIVNCPAPTAVPRSTTQTVSAPVALTQPASSAIFGTNDRLIIRRLGINAPVNISVVGADGAMGNPLGASDVVLYDFSAIPGLGGYPGLGGNTVIAGHVDYICCPAVFAGLRNIREGDIIEYVTASGGRYAYEVQWFGDYPPETNWASIVAGGPDIMTLITCNGTFDTSAREYSHRRVVRAVLVQLSES